MPAKVSEPFRFRVVAQSPDDSVWLGGNGNWADGTFNTLQTIVNSINPTTGGWAQLPGTTLARVLLTPDEANRIDRRIWQNEGSKACLTIWASAFWDGKSFIVGFCGGHGAYNGVEAYRVRVTDPPAAIRMYDPPPLLPGPRGGDIESIWGFSARHHYDTLLWVPQINKGVYIGQTAGAKPIMSFDPNAPTPKSAWQVICPADASLFIGYGSFCMMTDNEMYFASNTIGQNGVANLTTGVRRSLNPYPSDPFKVINSASYMYMRRASTALTSKVWFTVQRKTFDVLTYHVRSYDPQTGTFSALDAGNQFPSWWAPVVNTNYRTIALAIGAFGERIVGYSAHDFGGTGGDYKVFCYNPATNATLDYTSAANPKPTGSVNGTPAQRWQFVPQVKAFVALLKHTENVWVFRPPAAWGIA